MKAAWVDATGSWLLFRRTMREIMCVSSIQAGQGLAFSTTSKYLADLARVGLVSVKRSGKWSYYKRNEGAIKAVAARLKAEL